jgi:hypothetical protein
VIGHGDADIVSVPAEITRFLHGNLIAQNLLIKRIASLPVDLWRREGIHNAEILIQSGYRRDTRRHPPVLFVAIEKSDPVHQLDSREPEMFTFGQLSESISSIVAFSTLK